MAVRERQALEQAQAEFCLSLHDLEQVTGPCFQRECTSVKAFGRNGIHDWGVRRAQEELLSQLFYSGGTGRVTA